MVNWSWQVIPLNWVRSGVWTLGWPSSQPYGAPERLLSDVDLLTTFRLSNLNRWTPSTRDLFDAHNFDIEIDVSSPAIPAPIWSWTGSIVKVTNSFNLLKFCWFCTERCFLRAKISLVWFHEYFSKTIASIWREISKAKLRHVWFHKYFRKNIPSIWREISKAKPRHVWFHEYFRKDIPSIWREISTVLY